MKTFIDKDTSIEDPKDKEKKLTYSHFIKICIGRGPIGGMLMEQMRKNIKVLDKFENMKDNTVLLEDAEWEILRTCVNSFPWGMVHKDIVEMSDYIELLKS